MQYVSSPVKTLCMGQASSMASLLLCAGALLPVQGARVACLQQTAAGLSETAAALDVQAHRVSDASCQTRALCCTNPVVAPVARRQTSPFRPPKF